MIKNFDLKITMHKNHKLLFISFLLVHCEPVKQTELQHSSTIPTQEEIADSIEAQSSIADTIKEESSLFEQKVMISQEKFKTNRNLSYYLPIRIKNISNRKIKGIVLERTGIGLQQPISIGKFLVNIYPKQSKSMSLSLRQLGTNDEELYNSDGLNSIKFMHIIVGQVLYSDGEVEKVFNLPYNFENR